MADSMSTFDTAVLAYKDRCNRTGLVFQQPIEAMSKVVNGVVYLKISAGYLARYDIRRKRLLI
ncbi:hypothetical protein XM38_036240 [Halomicronema hongdechloris C2206]|uniref:Uncharacterized protein n=1 Tax=Halomicronema hongdechloris C2206 TaxID=1641165 RepID=A0A1Z3HQY3_9CYAN|nr:hypothetical protein [Halomicronema hongdechloris]ASC72666.1 hypothetical protein XM38_036240 [Halomicronema hongdechloris C2206]